MPPRDRQGPADATVLSRAEGQDRPLPSLRQRERGGLGGQEAGRRWGRVSREHQAGHLSESAEGWTRPCFKIATLGQFLQRA